MVFYNLRLRLKEKQILYNKKEKKSELLLPVFTIRVLTLKSVTKMTYLEIAQVATFTLKKNMLLRRKLIAY